MHRYETFCLLILSYFNFGGQEPQRGLFYQYSMKDINITQNNSTNLESNWEELLILLLTMFPQK